MKIEKHIYRAFQAFYIKDYGTFKSFFTVRGYLIHVQRKVLRTHYKVTNNENELSFDMLIDEDSKEITFYRGGDAVPVSKFLMKG